MQTIFLIGLGSFAGGVGRYLLSSFMHARFPSAFPYGTFAVNILGCLFIGITFTLFDKQALNHEWKLFIASGFLGGFTTFSAFSNETITLFRNGQPGIAAIYIAASVLLGLAATYGGYWLGK